MYMPLSMYLSMLLGSRIFMFLLNELITGTFFPWTNNIIITTKPSQHTFNNKFSRITNCEAKITMVYLQ